MNHDKRDIPKDITEIVAQQDLRDKYSNIDTLLRENKSFSLSELRKAYEEALQDQVHYFAHVIFKRATLSNNWGDVGQQQMEVSFCRNVLEISPEHDLTSSDSDTFYAILEKQYQELGLDSLTLDELNHKFETFKFDLFGYSYDIHDITELNHILQFLQSKFFIQGGYYGYDKEIIFGEGTLKKMADYDVIYFEKEHCRTPNTVTAMAAVIGDKQIFLRKESLDTIFYQKWVSSLEDHEWYRFLIMADQSRNLSEGIKQKTIQGYKADSKETLIKVQDQFIKDMGETILHHELGHGIIQYHTLPEYNATMGEASKMFGENIVTALLEICADIAPQHQDIHGPLINMAKIAQSDPDKARRMFNMYLSDVWFYDTEDEYMFIYADLILHIMVSHIDESRVNFDLLLKNLTMRKDYQAYYIQDQTYLEWAVHNVVKVTEDLKKIADRAVYNTNDKECDDKAYDLEALILQIHQELDDELIEKKDYTYWTALWADIFDKLITDSDSEQQARQCLKEHEKRILDEAFKKHLGSLETTLSGRAFIHHRLTELGFLKFSDNVQ